MAILLPNDVLAQHTYVEQFEPLRQAYEESVLQILSYENDPMVPKWLKAATEQFINRAKQIQKLAQAQAVVLKVLPRVQKSTSVVSIKKHEGEIMTIEEQAQALEQSYATFARQQTRQPWRTEEDRREALNTLKGHLREAERCLNLPATSDTNHARSS